MNTPKLWTKDFIFIFVANLFVALIFYLLMTTMAVYATKQFDASPSKAGLAVSIFIIGALVFRLLTGKYIEIIGRKRLLYGGLALFIISMILYFPVKNLGMLMLVRFIHGGAFGIANTAICIIAMDLIPDRRRGEGTGYFTLSATGATAIGPFLGIFITQHADYSLIFIFCTIFSIASLALALFVRIPEAIISSEQLQALKSGFKFSDFFAWDALPISTIMFFMGIGYSGIISFLNSYAIEINATDAAGFFFLIYAVFIFISRPFAGKLLDRRGDNIVMYPAMLFFSAGLLILGLGSGFAFILSSIFVALGFGTIVSCCQAIAVKISPKHHVGLATSTFFICTDAGNGIGPFLLGLVVPFSGYRGMFIILGIFVFLSIYIYYLLHGRKAAAWNK